MIVKIDAAKLLQLRQALYTSQSGRCRHEGCSYQHQVDCRCMFRYRSFTGLIDEGLREPLQTWIDELRLGMRVQALHGHFGANHNYWLTLRYNELLARYGKYPAILRQQCQDVLQIDTYPMRTAYASSDLPLPPLYGVDYLLYFCDDRGEQDMSRPMLMLEDCLYADDYSISRERVLEEVLPPVEILAYYQWEWGWLWDFGANRALSQQDWCENDGLGNGSLHPSDDRADPPFSCRYVPEVYWWHCQRIEALRAFLGRTQFNRFMRIALYTD